MLRTVAVFATACLGITVAYAQNLQAIKERRDVMRTIAKASSANFAMLKGEAPFDLATVKNGLNTFQDQMAKLKNFFPEDSKTGGDTDAKAQIWNARANFDAAMAAFSSTAKAAADAITDEASFKAEYSKVARSCGGCHGDAGFAPRLSESFKKLNQ